MKPRSLHIAPLWLCVGAMMLLVAPPVWAVPGDSLDSIPLAYSAPRDLDIAPDDTLWVVDSSAQAVVHLSADGQTVLDQFSTRSFGALQPTGLALASDSTLFIVDLQDLILYHRNSDGTEAATNPEIDLDALGLEDPHGVDLLPSGNYLILDGVDGTETVYEISADGSSVVSSFDTSSVGPTFAQGVTVHPGGDYWISEADSTTLYETDSSGSLLGSIDISGLGAVEPSGIAAASDGTLWTIDLDTGTLYHHTTAGASTGTPSEIAFTDTVGLGLLGVTGIARDPYGNPWVIDAGAKRVHRLTADGSASLFSFDYSGWSANATELDIGPDGCIYLIDSSTQTVTILEPDASALHGTITAAGIGASQINSLAVDYDGTLWIVDPFTLTVYHTSGDGSTPLGSFSLPGAYVPVPRDIEVAPSGTLWVANAQGASSTLVQLNTDGSLSSVVPSLPIGASLGITTPQSIAVLDIGDILVIDTIQTVLLTVEGPPPTIAQIIHIDQAAPIGVSASDELVMVFDQPVTLAGALETDDLYLSEAGDSLGAFTASSNPLNPKQIVITLGAGASLTVPGSGVGSSAMDISATIEAGDIIDAQTGTDVSPSSPQDILFNFIPSGTTTIGPGGGTVSVVNSTDAVYITHSLTVAPFAVASPQDFSLSVPSVSTGLVNAVEVSPSDAIFLNIDSTLTLGYTVHDLQNGDGGDEMQMRIHQLSDIGGGLYEAIPLPGLQTVDPVADTVSAPLASTNPLGVPDGDPTLFATLPLDTIDDRTIILEEEGGGLRLLRRSRDDASGGAVLVVGDQGLYTQHQIRFPGYIEAPEGVSVTIRDANIFERFGFPQTSGAIFTLETIGEIPTPVEITFEFREFPGSGDLVELNGTPGNPNQMRLAQRLSINEPFQFHDAWPASVTEYSTVITGGIEPFSERGFVVYGLAVNPGAPVPVELSVFTAD